MSQLVETIIILYPRRIATVIYGKIATHSKWTSFKFSTYSNQEKSHVKND